jgi:hypothetical protein
MNTLEKLVAARSLIAHPDNWCRGIRKTENGKGGLAYCAYGALDAVTRTNHNIGDDLPMLLLAALPSDYEPSFYKMGAGPVADYNNNKTHADILAVFDRAIERQRTIEGMKDAPAPVAVREAVGSR